MHSVLSGKTLFFIIHGHVHHIHLHRLCIFSVVIYIVHVYVQAKLLICHFHIFSDADPLYKNRAETKQIPTDREDFTDADLSKLPELHPPDVMPNGNVGTPTKVFLELIQQCRLPPVVIKKLGLTFPKTRTNKKYGDVPFDYGREIVETDFSDESVTCISGQGHKLLSEGEFQKDDVNNIAGPSQNTSENEESLKQTEQEEKCDKKKKSDRHWRRDPETKKRMKEKIEEKMIAESDHSEGVGNTILTRYGKKPSKHYDNVHLYKK